MTHDLRATLAATPSGKQEWKTPELKRIPLINVTKSTAGTGGDLALLSS